MNQRIHAIVHILNDSRTGTSISCLSEQFQVSQRTIRNDLKEINDLLQQSNLPIGNALGLTKYFYSDIKFVTQPNPASMLLGTSSEKSPRIWLGYFDILLELLSDQAPCMISFFLASQASRDSKVFSISAFCASVTQTSLPEI